MHIIAKIISTGRYLLTAANAVVSQGKRLSSAHLDSRRQVQLVSPDSSHFGPERTVYVLEVCGRALE